ncbi:hypothetical protein HCJ46_05205 [Listeria booriae]|nr:hypothetical protein [Listeria booriae]MBC1918141.1 hypothetical protein [Listeria booriae]MBC2206605.1 hypothetical protein [Listeria booriae]
MLHTVVIALAILVFLQTIYFFIRKNTDMGVMFLLIGVALLIISAIG